MNWSNGPSQLTRPGRQGDFNTDCEALSNLARMKTRQARKAESLLRSMRSSNNAPLSAAKQTQLLQEWKAIKAARGYQGPFPQWFLTFPCGLPTIDWLEDLVAYLKFNANNLAHEASCRRKRFKHQLQLDAKYASARQGYAAVRGSAHPPFTEVPAHRQAQVNWVEDQGPQQAWYACPDCETFLPRAPAQLGDCHCQVLDRDHDRVLGPRYCSRPMWPVPAASLPMNLHVTGSRCGSATKIYHTTSLIGRVSSEYWTEFRLILDRVPPIELLSVSHWRTAVQKMSYRKSTGICGWSPAELKLLPDAALQALAHIFQRSITVGLPEHMLKARVAVLAKVTCPETIKQSRPIIVFSTLYRIWGTVVSRQLLRTWSTTFHHGVMGSMPRRSARDLSYLQQHEIEIALQEGSELQGVSIDLVKCFNMLPLQPIAALMQNAGVPQQVAQAWIRNIRGVQRHPCFLNSIESGITGETGAPEGDPLSVTVYTAMPGLNLSTYVDNWAWQTKDVAVQLAAIPTILEFVAALGLRVDWGKTYVWGTSAKARTWWKAKGQSLFPTEVAVPVVASRCELGVPFQFQKGLQLATRNSRLAVGLDRLTNLAKQPRPLLEKAYLVPRPRTWFWGQLHIKCRTRNCI